MRRTRIWWFLLSLAVGVPASAGAGELGIQISVSDAPPPPVVVVREEPHVLLVPGSTVYVVDDDRVAYDSFHYGVYWYVCSGEFWYRGRTYRGPFQAVPARYVPQAVLNVPAKHWRFHPHGGPPGQMKKRGEAVVVREGREPRHGWH
jgi:hypothetical protein